VRVLGEEPGLGLPNQHTKACPRFQTMHCWCPPATGPSQPHEKDCFHYRRPDFWIGHEMQAQTFAAAALSWMETHPTHDPTPIECTCDHRFTAVGHAAFCPLDVSDDLVFAGDFVLGVDNAVANSEATVWASFSAGSSAGPCAAWFGGRSMRPAVEFAGSCENRREGSRVYRAGTRERS
jgi:hypothetical protein